MVDVLAAAGDTALLGPRGAAAAVGGRARGDRDGGVVLVEPQVARAGRPPLCEGASSTPVARASKPTHYALRQHVQDGGHERVESSISHGCERMV